MQNFNFFANFGNLIEKLNFWMYKQMKKVVVIAEEGERKLLSECPIAEELKASCPQVIVAGVGALNIMRSLRDLPLDTEIINIGYAGSLV